MLSVKPNITIHYHASYGNLGILTLYMRACLDDD